MYRNDKKGELPKITHEINETESQIIESWAISALQDLSKRSSEQFS